MKSLQALCLALGVATLLLLSGCHEGGPMEPQPCAEGFYWSPGYGCVAFPASAPYVTVATDYLNLRSCPSTKCAVIGSLSGGEQVQVLGAEGGWTQIWAYGRGQVGWAATKYLR